VQGVSPARCLAVGLLFASCATPYAYRFERVEQTDDSNLELSATLDPTAAHEIVLTVHNLSAQPLQVGWAKISLLVPGAEKAALRPESDLGWVAPGATVVAHLSPFTLPNAGDDAKAFDARRFELEIPMTVLDEPRIFRCPFVAHVAPL
jgi:hypothetical protein